MLNNAIDHALRPRVRGRARDDQRSVQRGETDGARSWFSRTRLPGGRQTRSELVTMRMRGTEELAEQEKQATEDGSDSLRPSSRAACPHYHSD